MKFRVFDTKTNKEVKGALVDCDGNIYLEGICGLEKIKGRIDFLIGKDIDGNPIYENDLLEIVGYGSDGCAFIDFEDPMMVIKGGIVPFAYYANRVKKKERE